MQKISSRPIGVFDSGLGGLTVVKELSKSLPHENLIYLGDTARVPYGPRGVETIKRFSEENTKFLIKKNVKAIVIACNTSSAIAAEYLKKKYKKIPIFEVIEAASIDAANDGFRIGVIGTRGTISSNAYPEKIVKLRPEVKVFSKACPLFVPFIEEGEVENDAIKIIIKNYLSEFNKDQISTLILGCTHYPIIKNEISRMLGKRVNLINPGESITREVLMYLESNNLLNTQKSPGDIRYFVTDLTDRFTKMAEMFLGRKIRNKLKLVKID